MRDIVRRLTSLDRKNDDHDDPDDHDGATVNDGQSWYTLRRRPQAKIYFEIEN